MKKNIIVGAITGLAAALLYLTFSGPQSPIDKTVLVNTFTSNGESTGKILIQVSFLRALEKITYIDIVFDTNNDGSFTAEETLVRDVPILPHADWRSGFYAIAETPITNDTKVHIVLDGTTHTAEVDIRTVEVGELLDLATVTDPENATKGWGVTMARAHGGDVQITQDNVPDLDQRKGECAPTAAANSLISLVAKNGGEDLVPGDPQDFIENLKRHMNWTPENGVPPDDFVTGKNLWAAAAGVPIRTTKVGDTHGLSTIDAIREALEQGDSAVELRIKFADAGATRVVGGHMVTVTGIHQADGQTYLDINDPATPNSGTERVEVRNNQLVNYGPWEHITILSWGFVQTWERHPTGALLDQMTDAEIQGIRQFAGEAPMITVIEYQKNHIPVSQLFVGLAHPPHDQGEGCSETHWHADAPVTSIEGKTFTDPNPGGCGFGTLKARPSKNVPAPQRNLPTNSSGDGAGILEGQ